MTRVRPQPGQVIRYAYLWHTEAAAGREEGVKDRPCAVLLAVEETDGVRVVVLPITHTPPGDPEDAVPVPLATAARLGLDDQPSWILLTEGNIFWWPGPDLRPRPGGGLETVVLGLLPARLFRQVRDRFIARWQRRQAELVRRTP